MSSPLRLCLCLVAAVATYLAAPDDAALRAGLTMLVAIGSLWMTQALHLSVTALLVPVLAVAFGVLSPAQALAPFAHPVVFLFLGGFALAAAFGRHGLDRWMAAQVMRRTSGRRAAAIASLFGMTAFLSMWISNTATAVLMLPLALGLLDPRPDVSGASSTPSAPPPAADGAADRAFVLLGVAYSASIGGFATLVGSPPNAIAGAAAGIGFAQWMAFGVPLALVLLPLMALILFVLIRPDLSGRVTVADAQDFEWTRGRITTVAVFAVAVTGWLAGPALARAVGIDQDTDGVVALLVVILLVGSGALRWPDLEREVQWGVLLLFGGGLALSVVLASTGTSAYLGQAVLAQLGGGPSWWSLVVMLGFVVFVTELLSNTAAAALLVPVLAGAAPSFGLDPRAAAAAVAIAASCGFMLPVATPPNAVVYGTGHIAPAVMLRCGFVLNLVCIAVIAGATLLLGQAR